jgi:hypothetical protein
MSSESISKTPRAVEIEAEVRQVKTMADGSVNVILNLPEYCMPQAQVLMGWVREQVKAVISV